MIPDQGLLLVITNVWAQNLARGWIDAWNSHDLEQILAHYADNFVMHSPVIAKFMDEPSAVLTGKPAVAVYWAKALAANPSLEFRLEQVLIGAGSVTVVYQGVRGLAAEVLMVGEDGKIVEAFAHYQ